MRIFVALVATFLLSLSFLPSVWSLYRPGHVTTHEDGEEVFRRTVANNGPWIVHVTHGRMDTFANALHSHLQRHQPAPAQLRGDNTKKLGKVKSIFRGRRIGDLNAIAVDGISYEDLESFPHVTYIQPDMVRTIAEYNWGTDRIDQASLPLSNTAYSPAITGCGVDVYVVDTGVDTTHSEFQNPETGRTVANIFTAFNGNANDANTDGNGHGTHCAGSIGGKTVGVSPCANIYGLKVLSDKGSGSDSDIIAALDLIKSRHLSKTGAMSVVSMSIGGACAKNNCANDALVLKVEELANAGIISAIAAGNENMNTKYSSPAAAPNAVTVGASDKNDERASFSNYGPLVDLFAPGVDIVSACTSRKLRKCDANGFQALSGTSMATPHVAGVLAQELKMFQDTGAITSFSNLTHVQAVRDALLCDAVGFKISNLPRTSTTSTLVQVPQATSTCSIAATATPTVTPTASPTKAPSITNYPTYKPTKKPKIKTVAPTKKPKRNRDHKH